MASYVALQPQYNLMERRRDTRASCGRVRTPRARVHPVLRPRAGLPDAASTARWRPGSTARARRACARPTSTSAASRCWTRWTRSPPRTTRAGRGGRAGVAARAADGARADRQRDLDRAAGGAARVRRQLELSAGADARARLTRARERRADARVPPAQRAALKLSSCPSGSRTDRLAVVLALRSARLRPGVAARLGERRSSASSAVASLELEVDPTQARRAVGRAAPRRGSATSSGRRGGGSRRPRGTPRTASGPVPPSRARRGRRRPRGRRRRPSDARARRPCPAATAAAARRRTARAGPRGRAAA